MRKIIEKDMFNVVKRIKSIDSNYFIFLNFETKKFELHYKNGLNFNFELVLPFEKLDSRSIKKVLESRIFKIEKILKEMERNNQKLEERNARLLKEELIEKTKTLFLKGV